MNKKTVKLYNLIFPLWMLMWFPQLWMITLPANFIIDLLVIWISMKHLQVEDVREKAKKVIFEVWIAGFAADFVGGFMMFLVNFMYTGNDTAFGKWWYENMANAVTYNPFETIYAFLWTTMCVVLSAVFIYFFNKKWCLKNAGLEEEQKKKVALSLAVFTAPYLFYLPTAWFW